MRRTPVPPHRPVDPRQSFPALEEQVLERWRERDVFHESLRRREGAEPWVFYEGPPTANGRPGAHHVLARVFKDIFPRYKTMRGLLRPAQGRLGLPRPAGRDRRRAEARAPRPRTRSSATASPSSTTQCRESVFEFLEDWNALTERIGFWIDLDDAYRTLDADYVESVWWALQPMCDKGLLYEGHKVVPYCPRCGTALSSHEVAQGYQDVEDPTSTCSFPVTRAGGPLSAGDTLLVWTTTPWTLVSNAAVAVDPELTYVRAQRAADAVLAEALVERVLGEDAESVDRFPGRSSSAPPTSRPSRSSPPSEYGDKGHTVLPGDFVSADDGTGIVHTAIAFGEDDFRLGQQTASTSSTRSGSTAPTTSASARSPAAGSRTPTPTWSPTSRAAAACCAPRRSSTPTRTAGAAGRR